jgi:fructose/tagatose bisphosphate aldolase
LVLHGGSGIRADDLRCAFRKGIAKINIGTTLRQAYEQERQGDVGKACAAVYRAAVQIIRDELGAAGTAVQLVGAACDRRASRFCQTSHESGLAKK